MKVTTAKNATAKIVNTAKSATKKVVAKVITKTKEAKAKVDSWIKAVQGYRVWKTLDLASYVAQGHGTIANLRSIEIRRVKDRATGQSVILHKSDLGYGYTWGKLIDGNTIHVGNIQVKFDAKQIVATFKDYAQFVKYVSKNGELNVSGTEKWKTLSNGGRYSIYTDGKQAIRFEGSGRASGNYHDYQQSGKLYGKFAQKVG